jgi:hypothetical protein
VKSRVFRKRQNVVVVAFDGQRVGADVGDGVFSGHFDGGAVKAGGSPVHHAVHQHGHRHLVQFHRGPALGCQGVPGTDADHRVGLTDPTVLKILVIFVGAAGFESLLHLGVPAQPPRRCERHRQMGRAPAAAPGRRGCTPSAGCSAVPAPRGSFFVLSSPETVEIRRRNPPGRADSRSCATRLRHPVYPGSRRRF